jgi:glyoxylase-like metal-dependent hydrolase (beta-lactamase superfamily II)
VRELRPGLWHWEATHPDWVHEGKPGVVSSYAIADPERLVLIDPLAVPEALLERTAGRVPAIVLTCPWHRRDAHRLVEELGAQVYVPPRDPQDPDPVEGTVFGEGERLPFGIEAYLGLERNDLVLWIERHRALVFGDTLVDLGDGVDLAWLRDGQTLDNAAAILAPLLELNVELVLPTHGQPADRASLEQALARSV